MGQLFEVVTAAQHDVTPQIPTQARLDHSAEPRPADPARELSDVVAVYPTRSEFTAKTPPSSLFHNARELRFACLSINLLCQQYADDDLTRLIESGATVRCLFFNPDGDAIKTREQEEGFEAGHLTALTRLNMQTLNRRVRNRLTPPARERLLIHTYDVTIRFNLTLIDRSTAVVQPYLHGIRGLESPTFMLRKNDTDTPGLFPVFEKMFDWLWDRSTPA